MATNKDLAAKVSELTKQKDALDKETQAAKEQMEKERKEQHANHSTEVTELLRTTLELHPLLPMHERTTCDDQTLANSGEEDGGTVRCTRCFLLSVMRQETWGLPSNKRLALQLVEF